MEVVGLVVVAYAAVSVVVTCALLTGVGAHRRGHAVGPVLLSAVFFPVAWAVWYLQDTRPLGLAGRRVA